MQQKLLSEHGEANEEMLCKLPKSLGLTSISSKKMQKTPT